MDGLLILNLRVIQLSVVEFIFCYLFFCWWPEGMDDCHVHGSVHGKALCNVLKAHEVGGMFLKKLRHFIERQVHLYGWRSSVSFVLLQKWEQDTDA